jgi:putative transcriptional regulator
MIKNGQNAVPKLVVNIDAAQGEQSLPTEPAPCVFSIRERTGLSQTAFARLLGVSVRTLQEWEQGRRIPSGAARTLLQIAHKHPQVLRGMA